MADAKCRIAYDFDTWNAATITKSSQKDSNLAATNLVHDHVSLPWRTTDVSSEWVVFDLGSAVNIKVFGMFVFNLRSTDTVTLQANASDSWGSPSYSQALTIPTNADSVVRQRIVFYLNETYRYWRVLITAAGHTDGYIEVGTMKGGTYYEFSRNFDQNLVLQMLDPSEGEESPGQQAFYTQRAKYRRAVVAFRLIDNTQKEKFLTIMEKIGNSRPCILGLDPTNNPSDMSMYCYSASPLELIGSVPDYWDAAQWVFEEKTR
jgi:hypothetical protein